MPITEVKFIHLLFWIQIHGLPVLSMTQKVSEVIGRTLGVMEHAPETVEDRGGGPCMRIKVRIDITKLLCRGRKILLDDNMKR